MFIAKHMIGQAIASMVALAVVACARTPSPAPEQSTAVLLRPTVLVRAATPTIIALPPPLLIPTPKERSRIQYGSRQSLEAPCTGRAALQPQVGYFHATFGARTYQGGPSETVTLDDVRPILAVLPQFGIDRKTVVLAPHKDRYIVAPGRRPPTLFEIAFTVSLDRQRSAECENGHVCGKDQRATRHR